MSFAFSKNKSNIIKWWDQACEDAKIGGKLPLLLFKKNNSKIYFMSNIRILGPILKDDIDYFTTKDPINVNDFIGIGLFDKLLQNIIKLEKANIDA